MARKFSHKNLGRHSQRRVCVHLERPQEVGLRWVHFSPARKYITSRRILATRSATTRRSGNAWFGPHLHASTDNGKTWQISEKGLEVKGITGKSWQVTEKGMELKATPDATLKRIWHIAPGAEDEPDVVYLGADPGVLFRSGDNGANWEMVAGLCNHPTREKWNPGAGGMMVHSIQCLGKGRLIVGISAAGAFRSNDSGKTWTPFNGNVLVDFGPEKFPEVGQCVHKLKAHPAIRRPLYQQNHCGVYRAGFSDEKWTDISKGLPSRFGFRLAVPAAEKDTLFTFPIDSAGGALCSQRKAPRGAQP